MAGCAGPTQRQAFKNLTIRMVAGFVDVAERKENLGCGGPQPSELFSLAFQPGTDSARDAGLHKGLDTLSSLPSARRVAPSAVRLSLLTILLAVHLPSHNEEARPAKGSAVDRRSPLREGHLIALSLSALERALPSGATLRSESGQ